EEHHTVYEDRKVEARANDHLTVGVNQHIKIGTGQFIDAGQEIHLDSGTKIVMEAGSELTLIGCGSFIKIDASGVTLSGPVINMNTGGSPGSGTRAAAALPVPPKPADTAPVGQLLGNAPLNKSATRNTSEKGKEALIVDVWGDPESGSQLQLLGPEDKA
ncbi:type VI secretion system tip protein VgrG, partial [Pseudomonas koreensis]